MTLNYVERLACLCLASFFLAHLILGVLLRVCAPVALRIAAQLPTRAATRLLLLLRLFPPACAILAVAAFCIPSYLQFEPYQASEQVGWKCAAAAFLGLFILMLSLTRTALAAARSFHSLRVLRNDSQQIALAGAPVLVVNSPAAPALALAGIFRPRLVISRRLMDTLQPEQLTAALRHESAHWTSHDNLKRLLLLLAPDPLPCVRLLAPLDRSWARFTEWAADDQAVAGNPRRSLALASALMQAARLTPNTVAVPLSSPLLPGTGHLAARVERLLVFEPPPAFDLTRYLRAGIAAAALTALAACLSYPLILSSLHDLLEALVG